MDGILEQLVMGAVQGIAEWLPINMEKLLVLLSGCLFGGSWGEVEVCAAGEAAALRTGSSLAIIVYFHREIIVLGGSLIRYDRAKKRNQIALRFLVISSIISILLWPAVCRSLAGTDLCHYLGRGITIATVALLGLTALLRLRTRDRPIKKSWDLKTFDGVLLGLVQGISMLPGLSRTGLTVSSLLIRKFDNPCALKLSFLMGLPVLLSYSISEMWGATFEAGSIIGLLTSLVFGLATIHLLMKFSRRVDYGLFVVTFAVFTLLSLFV